MSHNRYHTLAKEIAKALHFIHDDGKRGRIQSLKSYNDKNILSYAYLRKLVDMEIILQKGTSKKSSHYVWNSLDDPDYYELALSVIDYTPAKSRLVKEKQPLDQSLSKSQIDTVIRLTIRLHEKGYSPDEIQEEIPKLLEIAST